MREQEERRSNLASFKEGDVRFLICTDVAARGIDIAGLPYVIQVTLPDDKENYIRRIGRCGRAERMGLAIALVATEPEKVWYHKCPSKGKNCTPYPGNTKLTIPFGPDGKLKAKDADSWIIEEGGCTIWYDEPDLLKQVETRIGQKLKVMDAQSFAVPGLVASPFGDKQPSVAAESHEIKEQKSRRALLRQKEEAPLVVYGSKKDDKMLAMTFKHTSALAPLVKELAQLELEVQHLFMRDMWRGAPQARQALPTPARARETATSKAWPKHRREARW
eukprot:TRINITY_DN49138_c0_g1_i1.p1 TRINITY_DN49138_c0_g1~~TRINITY_DN49138_c0_g1_i1.p1  ORF type:complete len:285 (-),score=56.83 TRINITY_DN49138_c0_g1_i1:25-852(-)